MLLAKRIFLAAGIYGIVVLLPLYFMESSVGPPSITYPEYYYGFLAGAVPWQIAFLVISRDPLRYRPLMPAAMLEKGLFGFAVLALLATRGVASAVLVFALIDLVWGVLFAVAWSRTASTQTQTQVR